MPAKSMETVSSRRADWCPTWISWNASSATPATLSAGKRCRPRRDRLERPHRLRDPGAAPHHPAQEGSRPAAPGRRQRTAAPRRHVLAGGRRAVQRRPAFKIVCRDMRGVIVTLIADNYFGYSKKEIKSQISYAANLFGGQRGRAFRRRPLLPQLQPGRDLRTRQPPAGSRP